MVLLKMDDSDHSSWELKVQILGVALGFVIFFLQKNSQPCIRALLGRVVPSPRELLPSNGAAAAAAAASAALGVLINHPEDASDRGKDSKGPQMRSDQEQLGCLPNRS